VGFLPAQPFVPEEPNSELCALDQGTSEWEFCRFYRELCIIKKKQF
jgi:hypothetical protein